MPSMFVGCGSSLSIDRAVAAALTFRSVDLCSEGGVSKNPTKESVAPANEGYVANVCARAACVRLCVWAFCPLNCDSWFCYLCFFNVPIHFATGMSHAAKVRMLSKRPIDRRAALFGT